MNKKLRIVELFAGVGGFRLGFEKADSNYFKTVFASQWEPSSTNQFAFECYKNNFNGEGISEYSNKDIALVHTDHIPDHDILVGGFPCQDYSVAQSGAKGIQGKKGVLWWEIKRIILNKKPKYVLLENVDRLLKSPTEQRGRDFAIIIKSFDELGYDLEWRVINAAEYGEPQRRRRVFIFAIKRNIAFYTGTNSSIIENTGFFASSFPVNNFENEDAVTEIDGIHEMSLLNVSEEFNFKFENSGIFRNGLITTIKTFENNLNIRSFPMRNIITPCIDDSFFLTADQCKKNEDLKNGKRIERTSKDGNKYVYSEGKMNTYEDLNKPARTMLTSESTINRSSHFIIDPGNQRPRKITPEEAEQFNTFPIGWTDTGMSLRQRYFCMGNALVVNLIVKMALQIKEIDDNIN